MNKNRRARMFMKKEWKVDGKKWKRMNEQQRREVKRRR